MKLDKNFIALMVIGDLVICFYLGLIISDQFHWNSYDVLARSGVRTVGWVVEPVRPQDSTMVFGYRVAERVYTKRVPSHSPGYKIGDSVGEVWYRPDNPDESCLGDPVALRRELTGFIWLVRVFVSVFFLGGTLARLRWDNTWKGSLLRRISTRHK